MEIRTRQDGNATVYEYYFECDREMYEKRGQPWQPFYVCYIYN